MASASASTNSGKRRFAVTNDTTIRITAAAAPHIPMESTQPSLLPAIDEMMSPAMHPTKTTAHAMRTRRVEVGISGREACT